MCKQAMSLVVFTNRLMSGVIALSYVSIVRVLTAAGSFAAFAALSAVSVVFYCKCLPETAGKTLEQVRTTTAVQ
jgi:Sugar (and other) transporter